MSLPTIPTRQREEEINIYPSRLSVPSEVRSRDPRDEHVECEKSEEREGATSYEYVGPRPPINERAYKQKIDDDREV